MAIKATFTADFQSFHSAVQKAEVELRGFETGAGKVGSALNRMTDSLSGRKLIQEAVLMQRAVDEIGGTSKLTATELQRLGGTANEAADKMRRMGVDVPPGLQKIADEAKHVDTAHRTLGSTLKDVALGFAALFTARAALNFTKSLLSDASALKDLSQQTHINVEELQLLSGAMSEFGVDADTLGKGLFALSRRVAGGEDSVVKALATMGLSLKDVDSLQGEELFLKIEHGLSTLQGSLRDTTASDLFGSRLGMAMAGASEGIDGALAKTRELNTVMSKETVDALDEFDEAIARTNRSLSGMAANMVGPIAQAFNTLIAATEKSTSKWAIAWAMYKDFVATQMTGAQQTGNLTSLLVELNEKTEQYGATSKNLGATQQAVVGAFTDSITVYGSAAVKMKAVSDETQKAAAAHQKFEDAVDAATEKMHLNISALHRYVAAIPGARSGTGELGDEMLLLHGRSLGLEGVLIRGMPSALGVLQRGFSETAEEARSFGDVLGDMASSLTSLAQVSGESFSGIVQDIAKAVVSVKLLTESVKAYGDATTSLQRATAALGVAAGIYGYIASSIAAAQARLNAVKNEFDTMLEMVEHLESIRVEAERMGVSIDQAFDAKNLEEFRERVRAIDQEMADLAARVARYNLTWKDLSDPAQKMSGFTKSLTDLVSTFKALERAGYSADAIMGKMGDNFLKVLRDAKAGGVLEKFLADLVKMGRISQDVADKLRGLGESVDYKELTERASKYGISLAQLGPKFQQARISAIAQGYLEDFNDLIDAGGEINGVMIGMSDEMSDLINDAIKTGSAIPEAMRPMVETFFRAGQLVDENGEKLKDLSGVKFADSPLEKGLKDLNQTIRDLIETLGGVPGAIEDIANTKPPKIRIPVEYDYERFDPERGSPRGEPAYGSAGGRVTESGIQSFAGGGRVLPWPKSRGTDTVRAMLTPGETVRTKAQEAALKDGGAQTMTVYFQVDGRTLAKAAVPWIPGEVKRYGLA